MQTVVRAADAHAAMRALVDRLGPQAVLLATRRLADGVEMIGAPDAPDDPAAAARFGAEAAALGFDPELVEQLAAGPAAGREGLWRRFTGALERRIAVLPPPHEGAAGIAVVGPASRLALLDRLAAQLAAERPLMVVASAEDALVAVLARRHRLELLRPDLRRGLADAPAGVRLLIDLGGAETPLSALVAAQARARNVVRIGVVDADGLDPALGERADAMALLTEGAGLGAGLSLLAAEGLPLAYLAAAPGAPLAPVIPGRIGAAVAAALARLPAAVG